MKGGTSQNLSSIVPARILKEGQGHTYCKQSSHGLYICKELAIKQKINTKLKISLLKWAIKYLSFP